jgi:flagellar motor switch/type III secretory pathway protein FliN
MGTAMPQMGAGQGSDAQVVAAESEQALVAVTAPTLNATDAHTITAEEEVPDLQGPIARLPVEVDVAVPVRSFRVRNLLLLEPGYVIESQWANGEDMPLSAGLIQLAWGEFEVVENDLAVRITRLA